MHLRYFIRKRRAANVADYIPQLARVDPDQFAIAVSYCLALEEHGPDVVHQHVGREPSGVSFNSLTLNKMGRPHNPMINAGAIMSCSLIRPRDSLADRFDHMSRTWQRLAGGRPVGFHNSVYLSERETADRNFALGYSMREHNAFPAGTDLVQTLEFYFQSCSIEVDAAAHGDLHAIKVLAAAGADLSAANYDGRTPLHLAATEGQLAVVKYLLAHDAVVDSVDRWGGTPLSEADDGGHEEVAALLRAMSAPAV